MLFKDMDVRGFIAIVVLVGYVAADLLACVQFGIDPMLAMKDIVLIIIAFYFGNKSAMDTQGPVIVNNSPTPACPYVAKETTLGEPVEINV